MMKSAREQHLSRAVYATCLDVSFSRTGGCIAIAKKKNQKKALEYLNKDDLLNLAVTSKSALLDHLTSQPFDKIPRPIREEIAAMDGAIVLDHNGAITAAGAIVRVRGGSDGGGRRAAAKALSRLGLAIKVSSDGGITAFSDRGTKQNPEIAFEVSA
jgi:DNA integrity scanning protein DisA with diadenylate cyclase activity